MASAIYGLFRFPGRAPTAREPPGSGRSPFDGLPMAGVIDQECNGQASEPPSTTRPPGAALRNRVPASGEIDANYVHQG
ncbi:hypothetical protein [Streptomyces sp. 142MFCol3.1]|uniref:hypothetical protein n=1 Tax=Streptomyces sp. 142MFCol3.1 TaxID=1172179 RepID=UPI001319F8F2|nr:hypothetical protein [Streptomyces sp. 142MFCol3.1]